MSYKRRVDTLRILAGGNPILSRSNRLTAIYGELGRIATIRRRNAPDGWLLAVLHTTRALDTSLSELIDAKGWTNHRGLGGYFRELEARGVLTSNQRQAFRNNLANKRNKYMHEAGAMPSNLEADYLLAEMHHCLVVVLAVVR